jgi:cytochrome c5
MSPYGKTHLPFTFQIESLLKNWRDFTTRNRVFKIPDRMKPKPTVRILSTFPALIVLFSGISAYAYSAFPPTKPESAAPVMVQVPTWSHADLDFFLHGSMSTEVVPETVLRAFIKTYPDLFPKDDLSNLGLIPDPKFGWPVGLSRRKVSYLGGLSAVGVNCASCHVGEITPAAGGANLRILGMTSQFDVEGFFGTVIISTFRTMDPPNLKKFLAAWLAGNDPQSGDAGQKLFASEWRRQEQKIIAAIAADPTGAKDLPPGALFNPIKGDELRLNQKLLARKMDLPALAYSTLKLFHNLRAALHVPDAPPPVSPPNGPGRNDPWRILSLSLLGVVTEPAPVKFGIVWNEDQRTWVHDDGNTRSPIIRNLAASLGLGAPLIGHRGELDFALLQRHTAFAEVIRPPRYPWKIDRTAAESGAKIYSAACASCHDGPMTDERLHSIAEIQTDPNRATIFTPRVADGFNEFFAELKIKGYQPPQLPPLRSTRKYWSPGLAGVWARSPYLHNGSVRTMQELLTPPAARAKTFHRGSRVYDAAQMGYTDEGAYVLDTAGAGNSNSGHDYGTHLSAEQKQELIEFLKTL